MKCDTERENDGTSNTLGVKLGRQCGFIKISEKPSVKITRGYRWRKEKKKASGWGSLVAISLSSALDTKFEGP